MISDFYKVLSLDENATDEEIQERYEQLKAKYSEERFLEGEVGNEAARKLTELETAYREIVSMRNEKPSSSDGGYFKAIEEAIKRGDLNAAQSGLDSFNERNAEWHYLQSVVFYKKNWTNESKKQLEIAISMDPDNAKYKTAYEKLNNKINENSNKSFTDYSGNANENGANGHRASYYDDDRQMGGSGCMEWCCQMALCNMLLNCCCNCR